MLRSTMSRSITPAGVPYSRAICSFSLSTLIFSPGFSGKHVIRAPCFRLFQQLAGPHPTHGRMADRFREQLLQKAPRGGIVNQVMRQDTDGGPVVLPCPGEMIRQLRNQVSRIAAATRAAPINDVQVDVDCLHMVVRASLVTQNRNCAKP